MTFRVLLKNKSIRQEIKNFIRFSLCVCLPETPLSLAVQCEPGGGEAIRVLVEGGAHIDFRAKDGLTSIHKAVRGHRHTALLVNTLALL